MERPGKLSADPSAPELRSWDGSVVQRPAVIVAPRTVDELAAILADRVRYPSPVRALGSNHSTTSCTVAEGGTAVLMKHFDRVIAIAGDTVTVEAGARYIDVAHELRRHGKQFHVNLEIGCLSIGTAACGGTKDSSMAGELGQVSSYVIAMKLVTPAGELVEITEGQPELLRVARSSYGLLGIVYEVTLRIRPAAPMRVETLTYTLEAFERALPAIRARGDSMFMYLFPFNRKINVEFRRYVAGPAPKPNGWRWSVRNVFWRDALPFVGYLASKHIANKRVRYFVVDEVNALIVGLMRIIMTGDDTSATDQLIRFPPRGGRTKYCFSLWAFPEQQFPQMIRDYFDFCAAYYREHGYRCNMLNVGYRINQDDSSLFSYCHDGIVMTVDPVATGDPGWQDFLKAYNAFCSERGGRPLFNQTRWLTPAQARRAFGDKLDTFNEIRRRYDPEDRMLNDYFAGFFPRSSSQADLGTGERGELP
jgi:FAD binding domain/D-arabinono-1,4-lactone oxidase